MRKRFIAGNWKMFNGSKDTCDFFNKFMASVESNETLIQAIRENLLEIALFPPLLSIPCAIQCKGDFPVIVGAQNCHFEKQGAFTGEVSAPMVKEAKCTHVIIGHSERRHIFSETDSMLNKKLLSLLEENLIPVFCVGELIEEREAGKTFEVVERQIINGLVSISPEVIRERIIIAYEPVWAIGTGKTASNDDAQEVCAFIRRFVAEKYGDDVANKVLILYGGSVKPENTKGIMSQSDIDGVLIGGASLNADSFLSIIKESFI